MTAGYKNGLSLERDNLDRGYEPSNCRWIPKAEQYLNRSDSHFEMLNGEKKTVKEWSEDPRCEVSFGALKMRLHRGWTIATALKKFQSKPCSECSIVFTPRANNNNFCSRKCVSDWSNRRNYERNTFST